MDLKMQTPPNGQEIIKKYGAFLRLTVEIARL